MNIAQLPKLTVPRKKNTSSESRHDSTWTFDVHVWCAAARWGARNFKVTGRISWAATRRWPSRWNGSGKRRREKLRMGDLFWWSRIGIDPEIDGT